MKKVLVIGATGCMGAHLVPMLLQKGYAVDGVTLDAAVSNHPHLRYFQKDGTDVDVLSELLKNGYDGIIDFMHYPDIEDFKRKVRTFLENCKHYVFISSYRAYADSETPLTEVSPRLTEKYADDEFLICNDTYGVKKCLCEDVLRQSGFQHYTIVRPVVVYGENRYPIITWAGNIVPFRAKQNKKLLLPLEAKNKNAALIYAGDIAKEFIGVLFNKDAFAQAYTFGNTEELTWGDVATACQEICGLECVWIPAQEFAKMATGNVDPIPQGMITMLYYDRLFNRRVEVKKVLDSTGLTETDFLSFKEGLKICFSAFSNDYVPTEWEKRQGEYIDKYLKSKGV
jgi:nucleoside-diphosphate-sugar epimerase